MSSPTLAPSLPTTLKTDRLILRLLDPDSESDCQEFVGLYERYITRKVGPIPNVPTVQDIRLKHERTRPKAELCTLASPPRGMIHFIYLQAFENDGHNTSDSGPLVGHVLLSFRDEMPFPDLGYSILEAHEGRGYVSEAGRECLHFWHDEVGVKEICIATAVENNTAKRMGFEEGGQFTVVNGHPPNEEVEKAKAFVLPGMNWPDGPEVTLQRPARRQEAQLDSDKPL
ncbi:uncharacterized protein LTR77_003811 [Saxophila tyrrhenica]|uniref:N-acetyltransferase domain-containing protein n=1 Tax=Saxophila tyrrhenica TaxID=1690608 RepID=A0AAV9PEU4_9PEZI|nr:hypothetical protein LTR77_003811 [Saxophila tyrrhenica]